MRHILHIQAQKEYLDRRWKIIRLIREFFWQKQFQEVETPVLLTYAGQEPYLSPMHVSLHNERGDVYQAYLHTSPEYTMKKMLAAGYENIFSITKCFRDYESFGGLHNPEFTLLEFYEIGADVETLVERMKELFDFLHETLEMKDEKWNIKSISMRDLWKEVLAVDLDQYLDVLSMTALCRERGYTPIEGDAYEDVFYRIFLNEIEPALKDMGVVMITEYPVQMAALAQVSHTDSRYAERVEVYVHGIELANGFAELTDGQEQRKRFEEEQNMRRSLQKPVYQIDEEFLEAVDRLPRCAGIAVGVDRLVQAFLGCQSIDDVLVLPMSKQ